MVASTSVRVVMMDDFQAVKMTCDQIVDRADVIHAMRQINSILVRSSTRMYVVVDLLNNPSLPVSAILEEALEGLHQSRKLKEWLMIGRSPSGHLITRMMAIVSGRNNIRWFNSREEVMSYLINATGHQDQFKF